MLIQRKGPLIEILCPAKLNLYLEVKGKRPDGYHEIETIMQTVSIYDRLLIQEWESGTHLACSDLALPCDGRNLVKKAADAFRRATGIETGVKIYLEKDIPAGAGLAGGSSDAAGAIAGLNELFEAGLSREEMAKIGENVGSDVPFFFVGGAALCQGRGEKVTPLAAADTMNFVVLWPGFEVSTREVYERLNLNLTEHIENGRIFALRERLEQPGPLEELAGLFFNRLEEAALAVNAKLKDAKKGMAGTKPLSVTMTGSGSAFYGLCARKEDAEIRQSKLAGTSAGMVFTCESVGA